MLAKRCCFMVLPLVLLQDTPEDVLMAVSQGVDLFDCSYPLTATTNGYALSFPLNAQQAAARQQQQQQAGAHAPPVAASSNPFGVADAAAAAAGAAVEVDAGADDSKINLWAVRHRMDKGPLVQGCSCFTCANHSRAYIHHLLHTHEMLAGVLLEMHNTHWWLGFFGEIREAIQQQRLQEYVDWFNSQRAAQQQQEREGEAGQGQQHKQVWRPHEHAS
jgi:queuine tRNA-ribosyltransferase subunit QTRTD1